MVDRSGAPTTLGRMMSKLKDAVEASPAARASAVPRRGWWVAKHDDDAVTLKVPMPGLGKEHVKLWADQNTLVIKAEGDKEPAEDDDDGYETRYSRRIELPADDTYKMDQVKAEMKNGLLKITVPRVKEEERKDVLHVTVE
jgi:HSP20 family protein